MLSIIAIIITLYLKNEADKVNSDTKNMLIDIKTDAKLISQIALPELKAYGDLSRRVMSRLGDSLTGEYTEPPRDTVTETIKSEGS